MDTLIQTYPIQNILRYEFGLDIYGLMHYMYENNMIITGSIVTYSVHQWLNFNSDLDIWAQSTSYEKKNEFHTLLNLNGYCLTKIDYSNEGDQTDFSSKIEMVAHYAKPILNGEFKLIDVVYTKKKPEVILEFTDLRINTNYAKVIILNDILVFDINTTNTKSKKDLENKILTLNPKSLKNIYLNPYEANRKKQRFIKYLERGFIADEIIKQTYFEILDKFISGVDVLQPNGYGLSNQINNLINELEDYIKRREQIVSFA